MSTLKPTAPHAADFLIIGQGIAGGVLADQLLSRGHRVHVVDDGHKTSSTRVAAGMVNPLAGKRFALSPGSDWLLPAARSYFDDLAARSGRMLFHPLPIRRLLRNDQQQAQLDKRRHDPTYAPFLGEILPAGAVAHAHDPLGSFVIRQGGYVASVPLLDTLRERLHAANALIEGEFRHQDLKPLPDAVEWQGRRYRHVVFCEGMRLRDNPWFSKIPTDPVKGEILDLTTDVEPPSEVLNTGKWLLPTADGKLRLGATYDRSVLDLSPTPHAREHLLTAWRDLFPQGPNVHVTAQVAGIRVCTRDNQPLIGHHNKYANLWIFNGFGSKANSLVPGWAEVFIDSLDGRQTLPAAVNPYRR